jgi:proteasome lid subunit RPN8/RPN11
VKQRPVRIPERLRRAVLAHARKAQPLECCGFLLGHGARVAHALPMENAAASRTRYEIDDAAHIRLRRLLRGFDPPLEIVGVYHSHPAGAAAPSPTDIEQAMYPDWMYMIVGLGGSRPSLRAFRIRKGRAREIPLKIFRYSRI